MDHYPPNRAISVDLPTSPPTSPIATRELTKAERRRRVLADIDNAPFTRFHVRIVLTAGAGFFTDAYDLFAINLCATMIGQVYSSQGVITPHQELGLKIAAPIGNLIGQVLFGWFADKYGRKKIYGVELIIIMVSSFGQILAGRAPGVNIFGVLIVWRFIMGIGIGGDYPLSAVLTSEFSSKHYRGRMMAAVVALQGFGNIAASIVALVVTRAFKDAILDDADHSSVDFLWRLVIGIGMVPCALALYSRLTIPESPRFTLDVERNLEQAKSDADFVQNGKFDTMWDQVPVRVDVPKATRQDFIQYFSHLPNLLILFGCAWSWFALDFSFYGLGLNPNIIFNAIGFNPSTDPNPSAAQVYHSLRNLAVGNIVLSLAGLIPGYFASFYFIDKWGRRPIQLMGFAALTALFIVIGFGYNRITGHASRAFAVLYALSNFFQNFGPNVTTFIIPGELFPTRYRATSHGLSAACGKLGAVVAQIVFFYLKNVGGQNKSVDHILEILALFMLTGIGSTLLLPETMDKSLESLAGEEEDEANFNAPGMYQRAPTIPGRFGSLFRSRRSPSTHPAPNNDLP